MNSNQLQKRVTWVAGTRGEILLLGPAFLALSRALRPGEHHWFFHSGEQGMVAYQALDLLGLIPDEAAPLSHPAEEPAIRLKFMIERAEGFIRQRKGTHVVFGGYGPTAAGTAIYCHARGCRALWLRPPDPAGLIGRLRWESGLVRLIRACAPCVEERQIPAMPDWLALPSLAQWRRERPLEEDVPGLRAVAPLAIIAVLRRDWGSPGDVTGLLARATAAWAGATPEADWLVVSNLNARLEGPMRSLKQPPANLILSPPLPYPIWREALARARLIVTDSAPIAAEGLQCGAAVAAFGETACETGGESGATETARDRLTPIVPADLMSEAWLSRLKNIMEGRRADAAENPGDAPLWRIREMVEDWMRE